MDLNVYTDCKDFYQLRRGKVQLTFSEIL